MNPAHGEHEKQRGFADRALKCGISLLFFLCREATQLPARALGRRPRAKCVAIYYHSVPASQRQLFAKQLDRLLRWSCVVRSDQAAEPDWGKNRVVVTFDDGFEDFVTQAFPELQKRKVPATLFMIADGANRAFGWEGDAERLLSSEQLRSLPPELIIVGSHTLSHPMLTEMEEGQARREIGESRTKLEAMLGREVKQFSFPYGAFDERLVSLCREAGYERIYTTQPAYAFEHGDEFVVGRVRVDPTDWPLEFRLKVAGAYSWKPRAIVWKRQLRSAIRRFLAPASAGPAATRPAVR